LDQILFEAVGIHFLEPRIDYQEKTRIVKDKSQLPAKIAKGSQPRPKLSLGLKLAITKKDLSERQDYTEIAEVLEDILNKVEKGPKKLNQVVEGEKMKKESAEEEEKKREETRKQRDKLIKEKIKKNAPIKAEKELKAKEDEKLKKEKAKEEIKEF
jgi:hypothetical protein